MIRLAIYGVESIDTFRYNFFIFGNHFTMKCSDTVYLYAEDNLKNETLELFNKYFKHVVFKKVFLFNSNAVRKALILDEINFLIINSFTIADFRVLKAVNNLRVFTLYVQHGLYVRHMARNSRFFVDNFKRVFSSLYYVLELSAYNIVKIYHISMIYLRGKSRTHIPYELRSRTNLNIVLSEYWQDFHKETYHIDSDYFVAGFLDYLKFDVEAVDGIVYCAQTLVEDGRINKFTMLNFYQGLYDFALKKSITVFIKIHPRNSKWTIDLFQKFKFIIVNGKIPLGKMTIGHYSSLLPIWAINNCPVIIFELKNHPTPESILNLSSLTIQSFERINDSTLGHLNLNNRVVNYFGDKPDIRTINAAILQAYGYYFASVSN